MAVVAALALAAVLAVRPLASPDLGYHLAYGEQFLDSGRIVDHNPFIYTLPVGLQREGRPTGGDASAAGAWPVRPAPGPGCWYDTEGNYRFANANWLSQVFMAAAWRTGGPTGLCLLQAALAAGVFAAMLLAMRRLGVPWPVAAAGLMLAALAAHTRFNARPEVFGFLLLAIQLCVLSRRRVTWPAVGALAAMQVVFVNCHGYFMLALGMTGAFLAGRLAALAWRGLRPANMGYERQLSADSARLAAALAGQLAACFVNPWTWRLAALPVQTLAFMHANNIAGSGLTGPGGHPWSYIGEFFTPFAGPFADAKATYAFYALLALATAGVACSAARRRWDWLLLIGGMTAVSLTMRRNIAPAAIVVTPVALEACCSTLRRFWRRRSPRFRMEVARETSGLLIVAAAMMCYGVVTQRFYFADRSPARFGVGLSRLQLPLDAAEWLNRHAAGRRVWTDYTSSSNVHYFAGREAPVRDGPRSGDRFEVPIVTNTWAYPPEVMRRVLETYVDPAAFEAAREQYGFELVVLRADRATSALVARLAADAQWKLVRLDAQHVIFARAGFPAPAVTQEGLDVPAHLAAIRSSDPVPAGALHIGGLTLYHLGWLGPAAQAFAAAAAEDPSYYEAWNMNGYCLATLGAADLRQTGRKDKLLEARDCFRKALELKGDYAPAAANLLLVEQQLAGNRTPGAYAD